MTNRTELYAFLIIGNIYLAKLSTEGTAIFMMIVFACLALLAKVIK